MLKKISIQFILLLLSISLFSQKRITLNIAAVLAPLNYSIPKISTYTGFNGVIITSTGTDYLSSIGLGFKLGGYYKIFLKNNFYAGATLEVLKFDNNFLNKRPVIPLTFSLAYFGTRHRVVPLIDAGVGYGFFKEENVSAGRSIKSTGGVYTTASVGLGYRKESWKVYPYLSFGFCGLAFKNEIKPAGQSLADKSYTNYTPISIKLGIMAN